MLDTPSAIKAPSSSACSAGKTLFNHHFSSLILDSDATDHMCSDLKFFNKFARVYDKTHFITLPDGRKVQVKFSDSVVLTQKLSLYNVLFGPDFKYNLKFIQKL